MWILELKGFRYSRALSICDTVKLPISLHPKCEDLAVTQRRWSFTRISHRGLVQEKVQDINFLAEYFIACNKVTYTCSSTFVHSKWCSTHSKQRDHTMRQVITYQRFRIIKKYRTVNPKVVVVAYEICLFTRAFIKVL